MNTIIALALAALFQSNTLCNDEGSSHWSCDIANGQNYVAEHSQTGMATLEIRLGNVTITDYAGWECTSRGNVCTLDVGNPHHPLFGLTRVQTPTTANGSPSEISICLDFYTDTIPVNAPSCD